MIPALRSSLGLMAILLLLPACSVEESSLNANSTAPPAYSPAPEDGAVAPPPGDEKWIGPEGYGPAPSQ